MKKIGIVGHEPFLPISTGKDHKVFLVNSDEDMKKLILEHKHLGNLKDKIEFIAPNDLWLDRRKTGLIKFQDSLAELMIYDPINPPRKKLFTKISELGIKTYEDLNREYELIQNKESDRSANQRSLIIEFYNKVYEK